MINHHKGAAEFASVANSKTLFVAQGKRAALLVTPTRTGHRATARRFKDAHAALTWCDRAGANMVYTVNHTPARN